MRSVKINHKNIEVLFSFFNTLVSYHAIFRETINCREQDNIGVNCEDN